MTAQYTIKEAGYAFLYIANENATQVDVYFDDVVMTQSKGNVIQSNEYYAFGMQTANSWTRENTTGNQFLSNGGTELNSLTGLYDLDFRNFDPILGRMNQVDPLADKYGSHTPYNFGYNNPVYWSDPSGAEGGSAEWMVAQSNAFVQSQRDEVDKMYYRMYGKIGDDDLNGSAFPRYGPGDGGALMSAVGEIAEIRARSQGAEYGTNKYGQEGYWTTRRTWVGTSRSATADMDGRTKTLVIKDVFVPFAGGNKRGATQGRGNNSYMSAAMVISSALVLDDASGVGTVDDVLIPFLLGAAYLADIYHTAKYGNENYPGPWTTTKPDPTNSFYNSSGSRTYNSGDGPKLPPPEAAIGATILYKVLDLLQDSIDRHQKIDELLKNAAPQDATKYSIPKLGPR